MKKRKKRATTEPELDLQRFKNYKELREFSDKHVGQFSPQQNWAILERMRQLRYGYDPGEIKMDKTKMRIFHSVEEFRQETNREYEAEIKKYGPR